MIQQTSLNVENSFENSNISLNPNINNIVYRCRSCNSNNASNSPASQYIKLKQIQNSVRVASSLYTMNLAALNVYSKPKTNYTEVFIPQQYYLVSPDVNWNQMSDRPRPSNQVVYTGNGSTYHSSSTKRTITSLKPGGLSPGGRGVDIKHNSYQRYLNRIKGKGPVRRGIVPPDFDAPIKFNNAYPIYGGKTMKTSIVSGCNCEINGSSGNENALYIDGTQDRIYNVKYQFSVGDSVWAYNSIFEKYVNAIIISIDEIGRTAYVKFEDESYENVPLNQILIYFNCNCNYNDPNEKSLDYSFPNYITCDLLTSISTGEIINANNISVNI